MSAEPTKTFSELGAAIGCSSSEAQRRAELLPDEFFIRRGARRKLRAVCFFEAAARLSKRDLPSVSSSPELGEGTPTDPDGLEGPEPAYNFGKERARREHFEAERAKLKFLAEKRALLPAKELRQAYTGAVRQTATRILQVPGQLAAELAAEGDAYQIERALENALRQALEELRVEVAGVELLEKAPTEGEL